MTSFLSGGIGACLIMASLPFVAPAPVRSFQGITAADVEQAIRANFAAWNSGDIVRIAESDQQAGFGYRTRAPRARLSREDRLAGVRTFLASMEYFRVTLDEIHTAVDGDVGLAWGFFTEDFQVRGRAPEKVRVRFTFTLKKDKAGWRILLYHRDAQPFDEKGAYILTPATRK